jgi:hypothetical protein
MKKLAFAALLVTAATVLGATVFSQPIAWAAQAVDATITGPLDNGNVRVHEEGTAAVHEQGTASVHVTNASLSTTPPAPVRGGGGSVVFCAGAECGGDVRFVSRTTATALSVHMTAGVRSLDLGNSGGDIAARFLGPASGGEDRFVLALDRPVTFDVIGCNTTGGTDECAISWAGDTP